MNKFKLLLAIAALLAIISVSGISASAAGEVNINIASQEELMQLDGVGNAYALKIIEYREANGPFEKPEDIMNVKGIGTATFEKNKDRIIVVQLEEEATDME